MADDSERREKVVESRKSPAAGFGSKPHSFDFDLSHSFFSSPDFPFFFFFA